MPEILRPCPFCWEPTRLCGVYQKDVSTIKCERCGSEGPHTKGMVEAVKAWNIRTSDTLPLKIPLIKFEYITLLVDFGDLGDLNGLGAAGFEVVSVTHHPTRAYKHNVLLSRRLEMPKC